MRKHSEAAWNIASLYSHVLASETRDLAAHIDVALTAERKELATDVARLTKENKKLRDALAPFACLGLNELWPGDFNRARRALGQQATS